MDLEWRGRTMKGARDGHVDACWQDVAELVQGERALVRDGATIVRPDPGKQVLIQDADRRSAQAVDAG